MRINLNNVMRDWRWSQKKTLDAVCREIGVSKATLSRFERGETPDGETLTRLWRWLLKESK